MLSRNFQFLSEKNTTHTPSTHIHTLLHKSYGWIDRWMDGLNSTTFSSRISIKNILLLFYEEEGAQEPHHFRFSIRWVHLLREWETLLYSLSLLSALLCWQHRTKKTCYCFNTTTVYSSLLPLSFLSTLSRELLRCSVRVSRAKKGTDNNKAALK
jgi:hypothetical protein